MTLANGIMTKVGTGFSDALKREIEESDPDSYLGRGAELEGQPDPETDDRLTRDGKVRFPVFMRFRDRADMDPTLLQIEFGKK